MGYCDDHGVSLVASGYEWTCPDCDHFNTEIEVTERVKCGGCGKSFEVEDYHHADMA